MKGLSDLDRKDSSGAGGECAGSEEVVAASAAGKIYLLGREPERNGVNAGGNMGTREGFCFLLLFLFVCILKWEVTVLCCWQ